MFVKNSQNYKVAKWLEAGNTITTMQAIKKWGITRLASRIYDLKTSGYDIISTPCEHKTAAGKTVKVVKYKWNKWFKI